MRVSKKIFGNLGRILLVEVKIEKVDFVLINIYNANWEPAQIQILSDLCNNLHGVEDVEIKNIGLGGDLVYFFILTVMF